MHPIQMERGFVKRILFFLCMIISVKVTLKRDLHWGEAEGKKEFCLEIYLIRKGPDKFKHQILKVMM